MEKVRSLHIAFRVYPKERLLLEIMAGRENRGKSEMIRELIREGAARRGLYQVGLVQILSKYEVPIERE